MAGPVGCTAPCTATPPSPSSCSLPQAGGRPCPPHTSHPALYLLPHCSLSPQPNTRFLVLTFRAFSTELTYTDAQLSRHSFHHFSSPLHSSSPSSHPIPTLTAVGALGTHIRTLYYGLAGYPSSPVFTASRVRWCSNSSHGPRPALPLRVSDSLSRP